MPSSPIQDLGSKWADQHEAFVRECREIDIAYFTGTLKEWIQEKLSNERAKYDHDAADVDNATE